MMNGTVSGPTTPTGRRPGTPSSTKYCCSPQTVATFGYDSCPTTPTSAKHCRTLKRDGSGKLGRAGAPLVISGTLCAPAPSHVVTIPSKPSDSSASRWLLTVLYAIVMVLVIGFGTMGGCYGYRFATNLEPVQPSHVPTSPWECADDPKYTSWCSENAYKMCPGARSWYTDHQTQKELLINDQLAGSACWNENPTSNEELSAVWWAKHCPHACGICSDDEPKPVLGPCSVLERDERDAEVWGRRQLSASAQPLERRSYFDGQLDVFIIALPKLTTPPIVTTLRSHNLSSADIFAADDLRNSTAMELYKAGLISAGALLTLEDGRTRHHEMPTLGAAGLYLTHVRALQNSSSRWLLLLEEDVWLRDGPAFIDGLRLLMHKWEQVPFDAVMLTALVVHERPAWRNEKLWDSSTGEWLDPTHWFKATSSIDPAWDALGYRWLGKESSVLGTGAMLYSPQGRVRVGEALSKVPIEMQIDSEISMLNHADKMRVLVDLNPACSQIKDELWAMTHDSYHRQTRETEEQGKPAVEDRGRPTVEHASTIQTTRACPLCSMKPF